MSKFLERALEPFAHAVLYAMVIGTIFFSLATFYVVVARAL